MAGLSEGNSGSSGSLKAGNLVAMKVPNLNICYAVGWNISRVHRYLNNYISD
jgi:hypothetical protein